MAQTIAEMGDTRICLRKILGMDTDEDEAAQNEAAEPPTFGGFLSVTGNDIRSPAHAAGLIALIQMASGNPEGGILGSLGYSNRTSWVTANLPALFHRGGGPLGSFQPVSAQVLLRHLRSTQLLAKTFYTHDPSNDQSGARHEDVPEWARCWFSFFEAKENRDTQGAREARVRAERNEVVASVAGRQAPLGVDASNQRAAVRTETNRNRGSAAMRMQVVGQVDAERVDADEADDALAEGIDDDGQRNPAPRQRISNGTRRRNVHIGGDLSSRYKGIRGSYESLNRLTDAIAQSFVVPQQERALMCIVHEYAEVSQLMTRADSDAQRAFYAGVLADLNAERDNLRNVVTPNNKDVAEIE